MKSANAGCETIAVELAPHKITVNNIGPGAIYTPIDNDVEADKKMDSQLMGEIPLGRWGRPDEVAGLAVYLALGGRWLCDRQHPFY